ncbi:hypothetical protein MINTM008_55470 (plasmid) [Mycobacterium intracellulare]|uniref:Uncharacterized protein n=3 Tax=Mycobacterium TaxID=1763 RepID=A0A1A3BPK4_MYCAS|nr:hypothetical protein [Mycobacterium intracellulare]KLO33942.1 hypothetical protein ABW17_27550 [Mycobacterium nebraskense]OBI76914.1 hypothetical protein A9X01_00125 [Mycobacterium asiaticum]OCB56365.1 hypothetical protein A9X02_08535 [Mycobacterium malmoense]ORB69568.1 hypothetical protein BST44_25410 [Mycobacterium scrofulaceum]ORW04640.1 hypothetical protein AWC13_00520 [Mycobacterium kubicae]
MVLSAAELAADIVCVSVLAYMRFELAQNLRARDEVAAYARFVATCCGRHRRGTGPVAAREESRDAARPAAVAPQERGVLAGRVLARGVLAGRVLARVKRIEALLAAVPVSGESARDAGEVVVSVDSAGRLVGVSLPPECTVRYRAAELEEVLNRTLGAVSTPAAVSRRRQPIPA